VIFETIREREDTKWDEKSFYLKPLLEKLREYQISPTAVK
jgi:hypothetical protein